MTREPGCAADLTPVQLGMLFASSRSDTPGVYVEQRVWRMACVEDADRMALAWQTLFDRHDALRTAFHSRRQDESYRSVATSVHLAVAAVDLSSSPAERRDSALAGLLAADRDDGFDLERAPLARLLRVRMAPDDVRLVLTHHHLLLDGWSYETLLGELNHLLDGDATPPGPAPSFTRFVEWLRAQDTAPARAYWRTRLAGATPTLVTPELPLPTPVPGYWEFVLPVEADTVSALRTMARGYGLTLSTILHGCWAMVLGVCTRVPDVVFATTFATRPPDVPDVERIVGPLITTVPARVRVHPSASVVGWLQDLQADLVDAREQVPIPLGEVARDAGWGSLAALYDTAIAFENYTTAPCAPGRGDGVGGVDHEHLPARSQPEFPVTLVVKPGARDLRLKFVYDGASVDGPGIEVLAGLTATVLGHVAAQPTAAVGAVPLLATDRAWVPAARAGADRALRAGTVVELFERQVADRPDGIALSGDGTRVTYAELDRRTGRLAGLLRANGIGPGAVVGVHHERGVDQVVAVLAVLRAGGVYLPLDPSYPGQRIALMLDEIGAAAVLTNPDRAGELPECPAVILVEGDAEHDRPGAPSDRPGPADLAYVIYTSGSTGRPKGAMLAHRGLVNRLSWMTRECGLAAGDVVLQKTAVSFDVSVWELLWPLAFGACLHTLPVGTERDAALLDRAIAGSGCTVLHFVPSALAAFLNLKSGPYPGVRLLICSGEPLSADLVQAAARAFPHAERYNLYGPTEATIDVTYERLAGHGHAPPTIGRPIDNHQAYVLAAGGRLVPDGVIGELCVAGPGLAYGYVASPVLTAERFMPDPYGPPGTRLYRTGDLVRWSVDGKLEYVGRADGQVKVRGFRVECREIEAVLTGFDEVRGAVVVANGSGPDRYLVAYATLHGGPVADSSVSARLRGKLRDRLPDYLVPEQIITIAEIPLTSSGKVDRAGLPAVADGTRRRAAYVPPRTATERLVRDVWAHVLGVADIGVHDEFLDLGGHSLAAMRIAGRVGRFVGADVRADTALRASTVEAMARLIDGHAEASAAPVQSTTEGGPSPLSFAQQAMWVLDQMRPGDPFYNVPLAFRLHGEIRTAALWAALNQLVERHEGLRTRFSAVDGVPRQTVEEVMGLGLTVEQVDGADREARAHEMALEETLRPFDLSRPPLLRCRLLRLGTDDHVLVLVTHHVVSDAWSKAVLAHDLWALYDAAVRGGRADLPALPTRYREFAAAQRARVDGPAGGRDLAYWLGRLAGAPMVLRIPGALPPAPDPSHVGANLAFEIPADITAALERLARATSATLFMTVLAAFQGLLARWLDTDDLVVGMPTAGRLWPESHRVVGLFANLLPVRTDHSGDPTFVELLGRVRLTALDAYGHQEMPFDRLVEQLAPRREAGRGPLVQVTIQEIHLAGSVPAPLEPVELRVEPFEVDLTTARFDLSLVFRRTDSGALRGKLTHAVEVVPDAVARRLVEALPRLLQDVVERPADRLSVVGGPALRMLRADVPTAEPTPLAGAAARAPEPRTEAGSGQARLREGLARMWCDLLKVASVRPDDDFFLLGGHSLLAAQLRARVQADFDVDLPLRTIFNRSQLADLAEAVGELALLPRSAGLPPIQPQPR